MNIFSNSASKFTTTNYSATVSLDNSYLSDATWQIPKELEHTSIINGDANWITLGDKASFDVNVHLNKYSDPLTKFKTIYSYNHTNVYFYPYSNHAVCDSTGSPVPFHIKKINLYHLTETSDYDACKITFVPNRYINISASIG